MKAPFSEGDRVIVSRSVGDYYALVLDIEADRFGWDVLVLPEDSSVKRWVGSNLLTLARADGAS